LSHSLSQSKPISEQQTTDANKKQPNQKSPGSPQGDSTDEASRFDQSDTKMSDGAFGAQH